MSERFKELVLKTSDPKGPWVRIPLSPPSFSERLNLEKYPSGRRGSPAKGVGRVERREGSNPSFSAKKKTLEPQRFKGFFFVFQWFFRGSKRYERTRDDTVETCQNPVKNSHAFDLLHHGPIHPRIHHCVVKHLVHLP